MCLDNNQLSSLFLQTLPTCPPPTFMFYYSITSIIFHNSLSPVSTAHMSMGVWPFSGRWETYQTPLLNKINSPFPSGH